MKRFGCLVGFVCGLGLAACEETNPNLCNSGVANGGICRSWRDCESYLCVNIQDGQGVCGKTSSSCDSEHCGGKYCPPCEDGRQCSSNDYCMSGVCTAGVCAVPTYTDGVWNGDETDVDCGSKGPKCIVDKRCSQGSDCESGFCKKSTRGGSESCFGTCAAPPPDMAVVRDLAGSVDGSMSSTDLANVSSCADLIQDGTETDVDCGGTCATLEGKTCTSGQRCAVDGDCAIGWCHNGTCATAVGSYNVGDSSAPDCANLPNKELSCVEACARVFGGVSTDYACSTSMTAVDHAANIVCRAMGCQLGTETSKTVPYGCSAYCTDGCMKYNYCFK